MSKSAGYFDDPQRAEALRLARQFFRPREIRNRLPDPKPTQRTVRRWLEKARESGELPTRRQVIAQLLAEGKAKAAIARELKMSRSQVKNVAKEIEEQAEDLDTDEQVMAFIANPRRHSAARFVSSEVFGGRLLEIGVDLLDRNKGRSYEIGEDIERLFADLRLALPCAPERHLATCRMLQARGMRAAQLGRDNKHEAAVSLLRDVEPLALSGRCPGCAADYSRRRALATSLWAHSGLLDLWPEAFDWIKRAKQIYSEFDGHDLFGNGLAHCQYVNGFMLVNIGRPGDATAEAEKALALTADGCSPKLQGLLAYLLAVSQKDSNDLERLARARSSLARVAESVGAEIADSRMKLAWCGGYFDARLGRVQESVLALSTALELARDERHSAEASAIVADIGLVFPEPSEIRAQIESLSLDHELDMFPNWIRQPLRGSVLKLRKATQHGAKAIIDSAAALRKQAQGLSAGRVLMPSPVSLR